MKKNSEISKMFAYAGSRHWLTILGMILAGLSTMLSMIPFVCIWFVVRDLLNALAAGNMSLAAHSGTYAWWVVGFSVLSILLYFLALCCSHLAAFRTASNMRKAALHHIVTLPLGYFSQNASGRLRKIIDDNAGLTEEFLAHQLPDLTGAVVMSIAVLVLIFTFDWRLGLCCLVPLAISFFCMKQMMGGDNAHFMEGYMTALETMNKEAVEYIRGFPVVKVFQQTVYSFKNFHAAIEEYEKYASGGGKSTIADLAAGFCPVDSGKITLGGTDIAPIDSTALMKDFSVVFQNVVLFNNTVMENIRVGRKDATDADVMAAAKAAHCSEFIEKLPDGYQTVIGENGSTLSGGECQRLSIARALLKNAPVILLDEATASLDVDNEAEIQEAITHLVKGKTVLIIAHRMRTVENADKIVVLDGGVVAESGTHAELMEKNGLYRKLVELQAAAADWKLRV